MANGKRRVEVTILGMPLSVRTERDDAWVHQLAAQVSRRLEELRRAAPRANVQQLAVLVALNLAEELQLEREKSAAVVEDAAVLAQRALARVQDALMSLEADEALDGIAPDHVEARRARAEA